MTTAAMKAIKPMHAILRTRSKNAKYLLLRSSLIFNMRLAPMKVKPMKTVAAILTAKKAGTLVLTKAAIAGLSSMPLED